MVNIPKVTIVYRGSQSTSVNIDVADIKSLIWTSRYQKIGDFELVISVESAMNTNIQCDDILSIKYEPFTISHNSSVPMIVEKVAFKTDIENGNYCVISGRDCTIVYDRFAPSGLNIDYSLTDNVRDAILLSLNVCGCSLITGITLSLKELFNTNLNLFKLPRGLTISTLVYGNTLPSAQTPVDFSPYSLVQRLGSLFEFGVSSRFTAGTSNALPDLPLVPYFGVDRSNNVIFDKAHDNLISSEYSEDYYDYCNVVSIRDSQQLHGDWYAPEADGKPVTLSTRHKTIYVNSAESGIGTEQSKIVAEQFGKDSRPIVDFQCQVIPDHPYKFGVAYDLGDIVKVDDGLGHAFTARVSEAVINYDENGGYLNPTFDIMK